MALIHRRTPWSMKARGPRPCSATKLAQANHECRQLAGQDYSEEKIHSKQKGAGVRCPQDAVLQESSLP